MAGLFEDTGKSGRAGPPGRLAVIVDLTLHLDNTATRRAERTKLNDCNLNAERRDLESQAF